MTVYLLNEEVSFPPPECADSSGLLAVGGDLSAGRILLAYSMGIFPWYSEGRPILWWSPDPRLVMRPDELRVSRSLRQRIRKGGFEVTMDCAFGRVIRLCAEVHREEDGGTWITGEMIRAYEGLHALGHAHSVESWREGRLAGGLYGVSLGAAFFGESMFSLQSDASKVAFAALAGRLAGWGFDLIDCQVSSRHLMGLGAREVPRPEFLLMLSSAARKRVNAGRRWDALPQ